MFNSIKSLQTLNQIQYQPTDIESLIAQNLRPPLSVVPLDLIELIPALPRNVAYELHQQSQTLCFNKNIEDGEIMSTAEALTEIKGIPKRDGSGGGIRANRRRGGCLTSLNILGDRRSKNNTDVLDEQINKLTDEIAFQERYGTGSPELGKMKKKLAQLIKLSNRK